MNYRQERDLYKELQEKELVSADVNFGRSPEKLKADYLDVYEGVYAEVISTDRFLGPTITGAAPGHNILKHIDEFFILE